MLLAGSGGEELGAFAVVNGEVVGVVCHRGHAEGVEVNIGPAYKIRELAVGLFIKNIDVAVLSAGVLGGFFGVGGGVESVAVLGDTVGTAIGVLQVEVLIISAVVTAGVAVPCNDLYIFGDLPEGAEVVNGHTLAFVPEVVIRLAVKRPYDNAFTGLDEAGLGVLGKVGKIAYGVFILRKLKSGAVKVVAGLVFPLVVGEEGGYLNDSVFEHIVGGVVAVVGYAVVVKVESEIRVVVDLKHLKNVLAVGASACSVTLGVGAHFGYDKVGFGCRPRGSGLGRHYGSACKRCCRGQSNK